MTKKVFGIDCPGCGLQRSIVHLFKGEFLEAFHMYPAIYPLVSLILLVVAAQYFKFKFETQIKIFLGVLTAIVIVVNYMLKMNNLIH